MKTTRSPNTDDLFIALGHPLRRQILRKMITEDIETSPRELSADLGQSLSKLSYHVRVLAQRRAVALVRTRQSRGSTQHFYRSAVEAAWAHTALGVEDDPPTGSKRRGEEIG
jgi:DNA-binding transcriptional ArsR family regulator